MKNFFDKKTLDFHRQLRHQKISDTTIYIFWRAFYDEMPSPALKFSPLHTACFGGCHYFGYRILRLSCSVKLLLLAVLHKTLIAKRQSKIKSQNCHQRCFGILRTSVMGICASWYQFRTFFILGHPNIQPDWVELSYRSENSVRKYEMDH